MASEAEEELAALRKAYATGATKVKFRDREVEYASGADLRERLKHLERAISKPKLAGFAGFSRGGL